MGWGHISISIRLPESTIDKLKVIANKKGVPYQPLMGTSENIKSSWCESMKKQHKAFLCVAGWKPVSVKTTP